MITASRRTCGWTHAELVDSATVVGWMQLAAAGLRLGDEGWLFTGSLRPTLTFTEWESPRLLVAPEDLARDHVELAPVSRAGGSFFLGPGQVFMYPVIPLERWGLDVSSYGWQLEEVALRVLDLFGVSAERHADLGGLWTDQGRIARIGSSVRSGVALFGLVLNVDAVPEQERYIMRCSGDCGIAAIADHLDQVEVPDVETVASALADAFASVFDASLRAVSPPPTSSGRTERSSIVPRKDA